MKNLHDKEFVIFDVETTGLSYKNGDRVIEIAALKIRNFTIIEEFTSLINPERVVSYDAFLVNGISSDMLEGQPKAGEILPELLSFIGNACLVGHNIRFDINFINMELALAGYPPLNEKATIDTCRMAKGLLPGLNRYALETVAHFIGYRRRQEHRAMSDVLMTYAVFEKLMQIATNNNIDDVHLLMALFGIDRKTKQTTRLKLRAIMDSLQTRKSLRILYYGINSGTTHREITPQRILGEGKNAVLVAYCHLRQEERYFQVDQIVSLNEANG